MIVLDNLNKKRILTNLENSENCFLGCKCVSNESQMQKDDFVTYRTQSRLKALFTDRQHVTRCDIGFA